MCNICIYIYNEKTVKLKFISSTVWILSEYIRLGWHKIIYPKYILSYLNNLDKTKKNYYIHLFSTALLRRQQRKNPFKKTILDLILNNIQ